MACDFKSTWPPDEQNSPRMLSQVKNIDLHRAQRNVLRAVASFELLKGVFVLLVGIIAILLLHKDAWVIAESLLTILHVSTDR